jgi:hypothetical protein
MITTPPIFDKQFLLGQLALMLLLLAIVALIIYTAHPRRRKARRWQFGLRSLLIALTGAAGLLWVIGMILRHGH